MRRQCDIRAATLQKPTICSVEKMLGSMDEKTRGLSMYCGNGSTVAGDELKPDFG